MLCVLCVRTAEMVVACTSDDLALHAVFCWLFADLGGGDPCVLLLSGLDMGPSQNLVPLELLCEYVTGMLGNSKVGLGGAAVAKGVCAASAAAHTHCCGHRSKSLWLALPASLCAVAS